MKKTIRLLALLLTLVMIAGLVPVFVVSAEDSGEKSITLEKDTFEYGEDVIVTAVGEGKDWIGLYTASDPSDGSVTSIYWYYPAENPSVNIKETKSNSDRSDLFDLPVGEYRLVLFANDSYDVIATKEFSVVAAPETDDPTDVVLAEGQGSPFAGHKAGESFAVRYNVGDDRRLTAVKSHSLATYTAACQQLTHAVYQWNTDYSTTVAGKPLYTWIEKDHQDNAPLNVEIPDDLSLTGDLLFVTTVNQADNGITYWKAQNVVSDSATFFDNGTECDAFCISFVTRKALPDTKPKFVIDFSQYVEDAKTTFDFQNPNTLEWDNLLNSGYITFKATGGDPYTWIMGQKGLFDISTNKLGFMVVKYRTNHTGHMEFFVQRADGVQPGQDGSYACTDITGDGFWHTAIVDASGSWGKADTKLTIFRFDPLAAGDPTGCEIDVSYIAFFATREAAEAYAAAETVSKETKGELTYEDPAVLCLNGNYYTALNLLYLTDAGEGKYTGSDGKTYTLKGARVLNEKGIDTGYVVPGVLDDGRIVGVDQLIPLTYQDPLAGAVEIDGRKYIYDKKVAVTAAYKANDPEDTSVVSDKAGLSGAGMSPDTFFINEQTVQDGSAHDYIRNVLGGVIRDTGRNYSSVSFRGWAYTANDSSSITEYGYSLNNGEIIWNAAWVVAPEGGLDVAVGGHANVTRYKIDVDMASLEDGWYNVYLFVRDTSGAEFRLATWGDFKIVKGGSLEQTGYADADGNSYPMDSVILTEGEQKYVLVGAKDVTDGLTTGELDYDTVVDSWELDMATNVGTVNNNSASICDNEGSLFNDAGYTVPGKQMYNLWGANGSVVFESLPFAQYNTVEIIIGSDPTCDAFQVGFVTDAAEPFGKNQDKNNPNMTANLVSALCPAGSEGKPNLSGRGTGAGWNSVERLVRLDISNINYAGPVSLACGSVAPHTMIFAKVTFINYAEKVVHGKYVWDTTLNYVATPVAPLNPAEAVPVYVLDGEGLNPGADAMRTEASTYDYDKGCIRYTATGGDPNAGSAQIPAGTVVAPFMVVKYRTEVSCTGEVFVGVGAGATGGSNVPFGGDGYIYDGEWHYLIVDLRVSSDYNAETNVINHFRNDYVQGSGEWVEIEYYAFFDSYEKAEYYAENNLHVLPQPVKTFTATFVGEDGKVIKVINFKEGATKLVGVPVPPAKDGYTAAWEEYTLGSEDITIKVVYTKKDVTPETTAPVETETKKTETETEKPVVTTEAPVTTDEPATSGDATGANATTTAAAEDKGCKSVVAASGAIVLLAAAGAAVVLKKKKEND